MNKVTALTVFILIMVPISGLAFRHERLSPNPHYKLFDVIYNYSCGDGFKITEIEVPSKSNITIGFVQFSGLHFLSINFASNNTINSFEVKIYEEWEVYKGVPEPRFMFAMQRLAIKHIVFERAKFVECMDSYLYKRKAGKRK